MVLAPPVESTLIKCVHPKLEFHTGGVLNKTSSIIFKKHVSISLYLNRLSFLLIMLKSLSSDQLTPSSTTCLQSAHSSYLSSLYEPMLQIISNIMGFLSSLHSQSSSSVIDNLLTFLFHSITNCQKVQTRIPVFHLLLSITN